MSGTPVDGPPEEHHQPPALRRADSLVLVNTGDGKGKSSAAFGVVMRSVARGWPVAVVQSSSPATGTPARRRWPGSSAPTGSPSARASPGTARNAPEPLVDLADTATEMRVIKHAYQSGIRAMKGIDY